MQILSTIEFLYIICRENIEAPYAQAVTVYEMTDNDWILCPNLITEDSVATHFYAYTGTLLSTDIWRNFYVYWHTIAFCNALTKWKHFDGLWCISALCCWIVTFTHFQCRLESLWIFRFSGCSNLSKLYLLIWKVAALSKPKGLHRYIQISKEVVKKLRIRQ